MLPLHFTWRVKDGEKKRRREKTEGGEEGSGRRRRVGVGGCETNCGEALLALGHLSLPDTDGMAFFFFFLSLSARLLHKLQLKPRGARRGLMCARL